MSLLKNINDIRMKYRYQESIIFSFVVLFIGAVFSFLFYIFLGSFFDETLSEYISSITGKEISIILGYSVASGVVYSSHIKELFELIKIKDD